MQCPSCRSEARIGGIHCHTCGEPLENIFRQELETPIPTQDIPAGNEEKIIAVPSCYQCDRQDETLRIVVYPYVVSIVVVTFRRAFGGLMCRKHRNLYLVLASAITATIGWIGIPFGIIYAPIALFQLACGGIQLKVDNIQMLKSLAKHKYSQGDTEGAMKCLEACLQFGDDNDIRQEIKQYRMKLFTPQKETELRTKISSTVALLLGAALIGTAIGILDNVITGVFSLVFLGDILIYGALLSWSPFVAMAFIGGLALSQLIERVITRTSLRNSIIAVGISGLSALVAAYSIIQGQAIGDYVYLLFVERAFESVFHAILFGGVITVMGGFLWISVLIGETSEIIFMLFMVVVMVYYLIMAIRTAIRTLQWQKRTAAKDNIFYD